MSRYDSDNQKAPEDLDTEVAEVIDDEDFDDDDEGSGLNRKVIYIAGGMLFVFVIGIVFLINYLMGVDAGSPKKQVQMITVLAPPPPPPPPPEVEDPPEVEEEVEVPDEPEEAPDAPDVADEPLPGSDLGLDADGVAGADGFGLIGKKGGRSLLSSGGADEGRYSLYAGTVQQDLFEHLAEIKDIRRNRYSVLVNLWINSSGVIRRIVLANSTGIPELDKSIKLALNQMDRVSEAPPEGLPQPIRIRITSRL